ncbi:MAG: DNA recombination protein RmuC [Actinomycetota bacterium]|nr:DNA recombination protein RmuC [Actinomycetota bacterium]
MPGEVPGAPMAGPAPPRPEGACAVAVGIVVGVLVGLVVGVAAGMVARSGAVERARSEAAHLSAQLDAERRIGAERVATVEAARAQLAGEFERLSGEALDRASARFLELAGTRLDQVRHAADGDLAARERAIEHLLRPVRDELARYQAGIAELERQRHEAYAALREQVRQLAASEGELRAETGRLVTALRAPQVRGRWGELQLRRVVELAGMVEHCDFEEQVTTPDDGDGRFRPDLVVRLPGGGNVVVDAKVPMQAYLDANDASDDASRRAHLAAHARQLRSHVDALAGKAYWRRLEPSPEFVVAFVPGDPLLTAAMEHDPGLMEHAVANHVLLATPITLVALLRSVAYGWRQDSLAEHAREVQRLGAELYGRLATLGEHVGGVGRSLTAAVTAYNKAVGSLEGRVLVTARRFADLGVAGATASAIPDLPPVEAIPRQLHAPEVATDGGPSHTT